MRQSLGDQLRVRLTTGAEAVLSNMEYAQCSWRIIPKSTRGFASGSYRVVATLNENAAAFVGLPVIIANGTAVVLNNSDAKDLNEYTEDLIQRLYLWGLWLYKFDRKASKSEFEKARELCWTYLRDGAGDEPDAWNITPRWQASLLSGWLDRPREEISYLSQLLSQHDTMIANGKVCKMRFYHFRRERGALPRNVKDDLGVRVNRLYERLYGKTMSGLPRGPMPPIAKHFSDE